MSTTQILRINSGIHLEQFNFYLWEKDVVFYGSWTYEPTVNTSLAKLPKDTVSIWLITNGSLAKITIIKPSIELTAFKAGMDLH